MCSSDLDRMQVIMASPDFLPDVREVVKFSALELVNELKDRSKEVSLRTLIKTARIANTGNANWKSLAEYMLLQG